MREGKNSEAGVSAAAWFAVLERAIRGRDRELEETAREMLESFGVTVSFDKARWPVRSDD